MEKLRKNRHVQTRISDWFTVTKVEGKKKVDVEKTVTKEVQANHSLAGIGGKETESGW